MRKARHSYAVGGRAPDATAPAPGPGGRFRMRDEMSATRALALMASATPKPAMSPDEEEERSEEEGQGKTNTMIASPTRTSPVEELGHGERLVAHLPLPSGWERCVTEDGLPYFINHNDMSTHWCHPLEREADLPPGWENVQGTHGMFYLNHASKQATYTHPGTSKGSLTSINSMPELLKAQKEHNWILRMAGGNDKLAAQPLEEDLLAAYPLPDWFGDFAEDPAGVSARIAWLRHSPQELAMILKRLHRHYDADIVRAHDLPDPQAREALIEATQRKRAMAHDSILRHQVRHVEDL